MNRAQIRRVLYSALSAELRREVLLSGNPIGAELNRVWDVQKEMAAEFERRSKGEKLPVEWEEKTKGE